MEFPKIDEMAWFVAALAVLAITIFPACDRATLEANTAASQQKLASTDRAFVYLPNSVGFRSAGTSGINAFVAVSSSATLDQVAGAPFGASVTSITPMAVTTFDGRFLYTANPSFTEGVSGFAVESGSGALSVIPGSPFGSGNVHWIAVDPSGEWLLAPVDYVCSSGCTQPTSNISYLEVYRIHSSDGGLNQVSAPITHIPGSGPVAFTPDGKFVFVASNLTASISSFAFNQGSLQAVDQQPTGNNPVSIVITGKFLYVAGDQGVFGYSFDIAGRLTQLAANPMYSGLVSSAVLSPDGRMMFLANKPLARIVAFTVDGVTGAITEIGSILLSQEPYSLGVTPDSKHLISQTCSGISTNAVTSQLLMFGIAGTRLNAIPEETTPTSTGSCSYGMAVVAARP